MKGETKTLIGLGAAFLVALIVAVLVGGIFIGKGCAPTNTHVETGIDAGPGLEAIDEQEREAELRAQRELEMIERKRREDLEALEGEQREEYERVREEGPDAVLRWLNDFDRERFP